MDKFTRQVLAQTGLKVPIHGDDEVSVPVPLGFQFPFDGQRFEAIRVSTDGWLSFTHASPDPSSAGNLPDVAAPENLIAPFWDDLDFEQHPRARYHAVGDSFRVQYSNVLRKSTGERVTFQVELLADGVIRFVYVDVGSAPGVLAGVQSGDRSAAAVLEPARITSGVTVDLAPPLTLVNGGFEDGNFNGWTVATGAGQQLTPWTVSGPGGSTHRYWRPDSPACWQPWPV